MKSRPVPLHSARAVATLALEPAVIRFPHLDPVSLDLTDMDPRQSRLAKAIHRTVLQRWITIEYLLNQFLRQPMHALEPMLRATLLAGGAQLIFMDRLPVHAVVDETVQLARHLVRPGAAGMVNAVLRRLGKVVQQPTPGAEWEPAAERIPLQDGFIPLTYSCLPEPMKLAEHLAVATSHPLNLIERWIRLFGPQQATNIAWHGVQTPPLIVAVEAGANLQTSSEDYAVSPQPGFIRWLGDHDRLLSFLAQDSSRRVQDYASSLAVEATASLEPRVILDYCAGQGTKTRQLAILHPRARILATDIDADRLSVLANVASCFPNVQVASMSQLETQLVSEPADLILLDLPCSNTGVLARRLEARYRFHPRHQAAIVNLQRQISEKAMIFLAPAGSVLYSTCSIDEQENQQQVQWLCQKWKMQMERQQLSLPSGPGETYHDGSFHALLRRIRD